MAYSRENLNRRKRIIDGQKQLIEFLDAERFNKLVHLFDEKVDDAHNIIRYIRDERLRRGLSEDNVTMNSFVYNYHVGRGSLIVTIIKNMKEYVHLSIHISPKMLEPKDHGIIHFFKDIYNSRLKKGKKGPLYTLVHIEIPQNKPNSLHFFRIDGDNTAVNMLQGDYDADLVAEIDVILAVMNRIFDEDDTVYYIGNSDNIYPIHNKTNNVLKNVNHQNTIPKRQNTGSMLMPPLQYTNDIIKVHRRSHTSKIRRKAVNILANKKYNQKTLKTNGKN